MGVNLEDDVYIKPILKKNGLFVLKSQIVILSLGEAILFLG